MEKRWRAVVTMVASALAVQMALSTTAQAQEMCGQYDVRSVRSGTYFVQNNQWNPQGATQCISVDTASGDFWLTQNTNTGIYMGYPSIVKGQHYGNQSTGSGMPLQAKNIASLPTSWAVETPAVTSAESWNAAIELWFNQTPTSAGHGQNDGTELMVWLGRANFTPGGDYIADVEIGGTNWRITGARWGDGPNWQYIAYSVADETNLSGITLDFKKFMNDALTRSCGGSPCLNNDWWMTSVQAGFEVARGGLVPAPLKSKSFATAISAITTDRIGTDGKPIVNWMDEFQISAVGCAGGGGSASYTLTMGGTEVQSGPMTPAGGMFIATIPPLYDNHGDATLRTTVNCPTLPPVVTTTDFYVDPSGKVRTVEGAPIPQATVTLFQSTHAAGPFQVVPNGSPVMSPTNRRNPDLTSGTGAFGWDVMGGYYYKVRAQKAGCVSPTNPAQPYTESAVMFIGDPITNLDLRLRCPTQGGVKVTVTNDWGDGYCATLTVTNRTATPWVWNASFPVDGVINQIWNATYTQSGATATARGIDWNRTLAPGASTHDVGFCALRGPGAPGIADATVTINSDWGTGYCAAVKVTNNTSQRIDWTATFTAQGTIYNMWNATFTKAGSQVTIKGVAHNRTLQPGQSILDIGFCANR